MSFEPGSVMYTRRGDGGETSLHGPRRVPKDDARVEAYGTIDELNSLVGVAAAGERDRRTKDALEEVQRMLFKAGADAATEVDGAKEAFRISKKDTLKLEEMTDSLLKELPTLRNFVLPGGSETGARLQLARAVCRRAERRLLTASRASPLNPELLPFFNRLSSYLFNLSRAVNKKAGKKETVWKG